MSDDTQKDVNPIVTFAIEQPLVLGLALLILAVLVMGLLITTEAQYDTLNFVPVTYEAVVDVLMPVLFVALLVERTIEVFVSTGRKLKREPLDRQVLRTEEKIEQLLRRIALFQSQISEGRLNGLGEAELKPILVRLDKANGLLSKHQNAKRDAHADMEKYKGRTARISYIVGAFIGLIIGLAGLRVISPLVDYKLANWDTFQTFAFHSIDVVLTAALLAGGAGGIHQIISIFSEYSKKARSNV